MNDQFPAGEKEENQSNFLENAKQKRIFYIFLPPLILAVLLVVLIVWLMIPGNRLFGPNGNSRVLSVDELTELVERENSALLMQKNRLEEAIENAVCLDDGTLVLPDGRTPFGISLKPEQNTVINSGQADLGSQTSENQNGSISRSTPNSILPAAPRQYIVPSNTTVQPNATEITSLIDLIEKTTVLILNPNGEARGSGFFISPNLIVTNEHVISNNDGTIFAIGKSFNHVVPVELIASFGSSDMHADDFALLKVENIDNPYLLLRDPNESIQLNNVFAAGFPGDITEHDTEFDKLFEGDITATPSVVITNGTVNAVTELPSGDDLIMHSASISHGDSGGPLLDTCGNLLGVNTFVQTGTIRSIYFALPTERLVNFLNQNGVNIIATEESCEPKISSNIIENSVSSDSSTVNGN